MRFSKIVSTMVFVGALIGLAPSAHAQGLNNVSFGYDYKHASSGGDSVSFPAGFYVDLSGQVTPTRKELSWVGELTWGRHSESDQGVDVSDKVTTVGGGVRYSFLQNMKYTPWVQVLVGVAHDSVDAGTFGSDSENDGFIGFDGAVDYPLMMGWSLRGGVGYVRVFTQSEGTNVLRVHVGVTKNLKK